MLKNTTIATLTLNPCLDISAEVDEVAHTRKMRCSDERLDPGGGGINVSRAIKILGGEAAAVFPAGGQTGQSIISMLKDQGIDTHPIYTEQPTRQSFAIRERQSNKQYRFAFPGPELDRATWQKCLSILTELEPVPSWIVASGSLPPGVPADFYGQLASQFKDSSTRIILDTSGESLKSALDAQVYLIKPNRRELEYICECSLSENRDQEEKCREIVDQGGCEVLVLTLGKDGALLTTREDQFRVPGLEVEAVSAVGAGDSFVGAMVHALQQGKKLKDAFFYGIAAGTAALTTEATILCRKDETDAYYRLLQKQYGSEQ